MLAGLSRQPMHPTKSISIVAIFSSLIISTDWLIALPNVKLVDTLVFATSYYFGFRIGAAIAIVSEIAWGVINPLGFGGPIILFTVSGELLYALIGWSASHIWGEDFGPLSMENLYFGGLIAIGAFFFDLETNLATALIIHWPPTFASIAPWLVFGIPFAITHEVSDFVLGAALAPMLIHIFATKMKRDKVALQVPTHDPSGTKGVI